MRKASKLKGAGLRAGVRVFATLPRGAGTQECMSHAPDPFFHISYVDHRRQPSRRRAAGATVIVRRQRATHRLDNPFLHPAAVLGSCSSRPGRECRRCQRPTRPTIRAAPRRNIDSAHPSAQQHPELCFGAPGAFRFTPPEFCAAIPTLMPYDSFDTSKTPCNVASEQQRSAAGDGGGAGLWSDLAGAVAQRPGGGTATGWWHSGATARRGCWAAGTAVAGWSSPAGSSRRSFWRC